MTEIRIISQEGVGMKCICGGEMVEVDGKLLICNNCGKEELIL